MALPRLLAAKRVVNIRFVEAQLDRGGSGAPSRDAGASAVEYGLLVAAIAAVIVAVLFGVGVVVKGSFNKTSSCVSAAASSTC